MKKTILLMLVFYCFSCTENKTPNYYYSTTTNEIIKLTGEKSELFNFSDSNLTQMHCKILDKEMIQINYINYRYSKKKDSLIIFDFPDDQELFNERFVLAKFDYSKISIEDLNNNSWSMKIDRKDRLTETSYTEEQIIKIKNNLFAYYVKGNDTILGEKYIYETNFTDKFLTYKAGKYRIVIPIENKHKKLKILLFNGFNENKTYSLDLIK